MKKGFVKTVSLLVCMLLLVLTIAGCGGQTSDNSAQASSAVAQSTSQSADTSASGTPAPEKATAQIYVRSWDNKTYPDDPVVKQEIEKQTASTINLDLNIQAIPGDDFSNKLNVSLASGQQVDAFVDGVNQINAYRSKAGLVKDITDLINQYGSNIKKVTEQLSWDVVTQSGKIYAVPNYSEASSAAWVVRKDILDKYGIAMPKTVDEFEKMCETLKVKDPGMVPVVGNWWDMDTIIGPAFGKLFSTYKVPVDEEQRILPDYAIKDDALPFLQTYRKWIDNGWYDRDNLVTSGDAMNQMFLSGKAVVKMGSYYDVMNLGTELKKIDPNGSVAAITELNNGGHWSWSGPTNNALIITEQSKVADRLVQYMDWMVANQQNYDLAHYGIEGTHYVAKDGLLRGLPAGASDFSTVPYCGTQGSGTFGLTMQYLSMDRQMDNVSQDFLDAKQLNANTKWQTDPLVGKVTLDNSIEVKYPKLKTFEDDYWKMKLLTGVWPATEESIKKVYDAYMAAGGDEVSKEYYKQYKAAGN